MCHILLAQQEPTFVEARSYLYPINKRNNTNQK